MPRLSYTSNPLKALTVLGKHSGISKAIKFLRENDSSAKVKEIQAITPRPMKFSLQPRTRPMGPVGPHAYLLCLLALFYSPPNGSWGFSFFSKQTNNSPPSVESFVFSWLCFPPFRRRRLCHNDHCILPRLVLLRYHCLGSFLSAQLSTLVSRTSMEQLRYVVLSRFSNRVEIFCG